MSAIYDPLKPMLIGLIMVIAVLIWHYYNIEAAFYFLFAVYFLEFVFSISDAAEHMCDMEDFDGR